MSYNSNYTGDEVVELLGRQFVVPVVSSEPDNTLSQWHDDVLDKDTAFSVSDMCRYGDQVYQLVSIESGSYNWAVLSHVVYLPEGLLSINSDTTIADAVALLGDLEVLYNNVKRGCRFAVKGSASGTLQHYINVDISVIKTGTIYSINMSFVYNPKDAGIVSKSATFVTTKNSTSQNKIKYNSVNLLDIPKRIALPNDLYLLDFSNTVTSDRISTAVGGPTGFKKLINDIIAGGECYFKGFGVEGFGINLSDIPASCMGQIYDTGETIQYYLAINCNGYGFQSECGGHLLLLYTESDTVSGFECVEHKAYNAT